MFSVNDTRLFRPYFLSQTIRVLRMEFKLVLFLVQIVASYGRIGHSLSGKIAQELLTAEGKALVSSLIPEFQGNLANACNWGDTIKSNHSYDWAKALHYINPVNDDPPRTCLYEPKGDCPGEVCVVAAIRNYTAKLMDSTADRNEALKFLIHFIGDIHQPLHATGRDRGGTQAQVRFAHQVTNMHTVWDYKMFEVLRAD